MVLQVHSYISVSGFRNVVFAQMSSNDVFRAYQQNIFSRKLSATLKIWPVWLFFAAFLKLGQFHFIMAAPFSFFLVAEYLETYGVFVNFISRTIIGTIIKRVLGTGFDEAEQMFEWVATRRVSTFLRL